MENENKENECPEDIRLDWLETPKTGGARDARKRQRNITRATVLSAMISALGVVILWLGYASQVADLASVALAATLIVVAQIELGSPWKWLIGIVTATLAFILLPDKLLAIIYFFFGALYPLIKYEVQKLGFLLGWAVKLVYCNLLLTGVLALANFVFMLPSDEYGFSVLIYLLGNLIFIVGDMYVSVLTVNYARKLRPRIAKIFRLK